MLTTSTILTKGFGSRAPGVAVMALLGAALLGCDAGSSVGSTPASEGIRLDQSAVRVDEGSSVRLRVLSDGTGTARELGAGLLVWTVRDPEIASVSDGLVMGLRPGATRVTVTFGGRQTASADVQVVAVPGEIEVLAGGDQVATVGTRLPEPIVVRVLSRNGSPMAGTRLAFQANGGGSISPAQLTTDAAGEATAMWTLGTGAGVQSVDVRMADHEIALVVTADARPDEVADVDVSPVDARTNPGGKVRFMAVARDRWGNAVTDARISWRVLNEAIASIDDEGVATVLAEGTTEVEAAAQGVSGTANGGSGGSGEVTGRGRIESMDARVPGQVDDLTVAGTTATTAALRFTEISDGTGHPARYEVRYDVAPLRDEFTSARHVAQGSCVTPIPGTAVGARRTCTVEGLESGVTYDFQIVAFRTVDGEVLYGTPSSVATGTTTAAAQPTTVMVVSGAAQTAPAGSLLAKPLVVRVLDAAGNPMRGVRVEWSPTTGSGSVSSGETETSSAGTAQVHWTLGPLAGTQTVRARVGALPPATFLATAQSGSIAAISISPSSVTLKTGQTVSLAARAEDGQGNPVDGLMYTWTSDAPATATVSSSGQVTGISAGETVVRVSAAGKQAIATVSVTAPAAKGGQPEPKAPEVVGTLEAVSAGTNSVELRFTQVDDGTGKPANYQIRYHPAPMSWNWGSATPVSQGSCAGKVTGTEIGAVRTCTVEGLDAARTYDFQLVAYRGTIGVDVVYAPELSNVVRATTLAPAVGSLSISPVGGPLTAINATLQLSATAKDASGSVVSSPGISWTSSNDAVATVDGNGKVTAKGAGTALITAIAACCGSDVVTITVAPVVASVSVSPATATLQVDGALDLDATPRDANGYPVGGQGVEWTVVDPTLATVSADGTVRGLRGGQTQVRAVANGITGTATISIEEPLTAPAPPPSSDYPNEPSGFAWLAEVDFSQPKAAPFGYKERNCCYRSVSDPSAPASPGAIGRAEFGAGYTAGGVEPFTIRSPQFTAAPRELYVAFWLRMSDNWVGHQSSVNKIFHVWTGRSNVVVISATGAGNEPLILQVRTQPSAQYARNLSPNRSAGIVNRGEWVLVEWVLKASSAPGRPDGESHVWLNGDKVSEFRDVILAAAAGDTMWEMLEWAPTWGGVGNKPVPATQFMDIDHIYISGR